MLKQKKKKQKEPNQKKNTEKSTRSFVGIVN